MQHTLRLLDETTRWRARDARYIEGTWDLLRSSVPEFEMMDYSVEPEGSANPYLKSVVRLPRSKFERPVPVGVVSNKYTLAPHGAVVAQCLEGIRRAGIETSTLRCQLGLTELGEWMHLRIYFPGRFDHVPRDGNKLSLRLECFNSVDGSSRLVILLGWLRVVCSNGMVIGETVADVRDIHNEHMDLERIPPIVVDAVARIQPDRERLTVWEKTAVAPLQIAHWADHVLPREWGKKAACRAFHICTSGFDVEYRNPFAAGSPTTKPVERTQCVPGAPELAENLYDVSQALSWIASKRSTADECVEWQTQIPALLDELNELKELG